MQFFTIPFSLDCTELISRSHQSEWPHSLQLAYIPQLHPHQTHFSPEDVPSKTMVSTYYYMVSKPRTPESEHNQKVKLWKTSTHKCNNHFAGLGGGGKLQFKRFYVMQHFPEAQPLYK
jgi:hypothetical protein